MCTASRTAALHPWRKALMSKPASSVVFLRLLSWRLPKGFSCMLFPLVVFLLCSSFLSCPRHAIPVFENPGHPVDSSLWISTWEQNCAVKTLVEDFFRQTQYRILLYRFILSILLLLLIHILITSYFISSHQSVSKVAISCLSRAFGLKHISALLKQPRADRSAGTKLWNAQGSYRLLVALLLVVRH